MWNAGANRVSTGSAGQHKVKRRRTLLTFTNGGTEIDKTDKPLTQEGKKKKVGLVGGVLHATQGMRVEEWSSKGRRIGSEEGGKGD